MQSYDPQKQPDPQAWLELDELERIRLAVDFHRRQREKVPNMTGHAVIHSIVETQAAMGDDIPVAKKLERLQSEGLDRHDAIHAIGLVLAENMQQLISNADQTGDPDATYWTALENLTAKKWMEAE